METIVKELITTPQDSELDDWENELTKEMDRHLTKDWKKTIKQGYMQGTYIYHPGARKDGMALRFPGATRGHIDLNENGIITNIVLYDTATEEKMGRCYKISVLDAVKKFIGYKVVISRNKCLNCPIHLENRRTVFECSRCMEGGE